jgi:ATP-binding cassette subfamily F protein uup
MAVSEARLSGKLVIEAERISKSYGDRAIVRDFSIRVLRGDRIGIVGQNGAGKTTLINMLTGQLAPDEGEVRIGANVELASLDQRRMTLDPQSTLKDALTGGGSDFVEVNGERKHVIGYMKDFLFTPEQARTPVSRLSGGERGRLTLARALALPSNLIVLDEPTNDLDLETLDLLQEMLTDYPGTVIVVSHDRDFLDRVSTSVIVSEGDGKWQEYAGGYSDMVAQRGQGVGSGTSRKMIPQKGEEMRPAPVLSAVASPAKKGRMSFKQKHALETLPARMADLQAQMAKLQTRLDDSELYSKDPATFARVSAAFAQAEKELATAEEQWLELEVLREELEG